MTFGNYILRLRQRLQDLRTSSGTVISLISDNGIRWSANNLIEISNTAITEAVRLINQYSTSNLMKSLGQGFFEAFTDVTMSAGSGLISNYMLDVIAVNDIEGSGITDPRPFTPLSPDKYDETLNENSKPFSDMYIYTVRFSLSLGQRRLYASRAGVPVATGSLRVTGIYNKSDYGTSDSAVELFLRGLDDFILDIAERECRDREHNWDRSQILDARIALKLGIQMNRSQQ